jgi:hypothetical protein
MLALNSGPDEKRRKKAQRSEKEFLYPAIED